MGHPVAAKVRAARQAHKWSQYRLAVQANVHPQTVGLVERGASVSAETLEKLGKALGLNLNATSQAAARE